MEQMQTEVDVRQDVVKSNNELFSSLSLDVCSLLRPREWDYINRATKECRNIPVGKLLAEIQASMEYQVPANGKKSNKEMNEGKTPEAVND